MNPEVIRRRLQRFAEYRRILERFRDYDLATFVSDPEHYGSAERFLQLAIEATLDIGSHIVAEENLGGIEQSRDIPRRLREHGHITEDLEHRWIQMIGFWNILVHAYMDIDRAIVHDLLCNRLSDLDELESAFAKFL